MAKLVREEKVIRDENVRLQRRLQMEVDRREALCRHLSESESSLEMDDERHFNESSRVRTISSPVTGYANNNNSSQVQQSAALSTSSVGNTSATAPTTQSSSMQSTLSQTNPLRAEIPSNWVPLFFKSISQSHI
jgi:hypothetical protein